MTPPSNPNRFVKAVQTSGLTIYDQIEVGDPNLWIPSPELESLLNQSLAGLDLAGLPLRTRSKVVKQHVCRSLGYPVPDTFRKTKPRFPGQMFDTYIQKSNNLQVWNEELAPTRRYAIIRVSEDGKITRVRVVPGDTLGRLDTTGTLTQKFQARCIPGQEKAEIIAPCDTEILRPLVSNRVVLGASAKPTLHPRVGELLSISSIFQRLKRLLGKQFRDTGSDQERNRGAALHRLVCKALGYSAYQDDGRFPDVRHQLLEVKLQTSPTIDVGLVRPDSTDPLDVPQLSRHTVRHCDVRYAVFYACTAGRTVQLTHLFVTTGERFFSRFPQFQGKVLNRKLQIPLPADFFDT